MDIYQVLRLKKEFFLKYDMSPNRIIMTQKDRDTFLSEAMFWDAHTLLQEQTIAGMRVSIIEKGKPYVEHVLNEKV